MPQFVSNRTSVPVNVDIVKENGDKDSVYLMGKPGRINLQAGQKVDPNWLARNPGIVNVFDV